MPQGKEWLPSWDLSGLYSGPKDPRIEKDIASAKRRAKAFERKYRGKVTAMTNAPRRLYDALREYEKVLCLAERISSFAWLRFMANMNGPGHGSLSQRTEVAQSEVETMLACIEYELQALDNASYRKLLDAPCLAPYRSFLKTTRLRLTHTLSEPEEKILEQGRLYGRNVMLRLYDERMGAKRYTIRTGGVVRRLSDAKLDSLLANTDDRRVHRAAYRAVTNGLKEDVGEMALIATALAADRIAEAKARGFRNVKAQELDDHDVDPKIADALITAVSEAAPLLRRFYQLKSRMVGLAPLRSYDLGSTSDAITMSFASAKEVITAAFTEFCPTFSAVAVSCFDERRIDAARREGKTETNCNIPIPPDFSPYVLANFDGDFYDIVTLAHELGHAAHWSLLGGSQTWINAEPATAVLETVAVFSEFIVSDWMKRQAHDDDRFALLIGEIENAIEMVFTNAQVHLFARDVFAAIATGTEPGADGIAAAWKVRRKALHPGVVMEPGAEVRWVTEDFLFHDPFGSIVYPLAYLLAGELHEQYLRDGQAFVAKFVRVMQDTLWTNDFARSFGIRLSDPRLWRRNLRRLDRLMTEAERLYEKR